MTSEFLAGTFLSETVDDARLLRVVGRHFQFHAVADDETDEPFPHFPGNVGQNRVLCAIQLHTEHGPSEHGRDGAFYLKAFLRFRSIIDFLLRTPPS